MNVLAESWWALDEVLWKSWGQRSTQGLLGHFLLCDSGKNNCLLRFAHVCSGGYTSHMGVRGGSDEVSAR